MKSQVLAGLIVLAIVSGCSDSSPEATVYQTPKGEIYEGEVQQSPAMPASGMAMTADNLPAGSLANADDPTWTAPETWTEKPSNSVRRGSFAAGPEGEVDISITVFPGDVGGLLANVNRWANQIGIPSIADNQLPEVTESKSWQNVSGIQVDLDGSSLSTIAAILEKDGNSWFIKMTGPSDQVSNERSAFDAFLNTVQFPEQ